MVVFIRGEIGEIPDIALPVVVINERSLTLGGMTTFHRIQDALNTTNNDVSVFIETMQLMELLGLGSHYLLE